MSIDDAAAYVAELNELKDVYGVASAMVVDERLQRLIAGRHAYMVASGGAAPAAILASDLHSASMGASAEQLSPLAFVERRRKEPGSVVIVFSARARHPDTSLAVTHALTAGLQVVLVTAMNSDELPALYQHPRVATLTVPTFRTRDGFLATGSVLAMACGAAALCGVALPDSLNLRALTEDPAADPLIILHAAAGRAAAADAKIRFEELGLGSVEIVDYRNFAHGRHVGLSRRADRAGILALITPESAALAERTLATLPSEVVPVRLVSGRQGIAGALELLAAVMWLPVTAARQQHVSPAKPQVPPFGRELYHLPFRRMYPVQYDSAVSRKAESIGTAPGVADDLIDASYNAWRRVVRRQTISAVVADYDGTCVETINRYELPRGEVREALLSVLESGVRVAFASGRGGSLHRDLRAWVPERHWKHVLLGLHNGSWLQPLDEELTESEVFLEWLDTLCALLEPYLRSRLLSIRRSATQVGIEPRAGMSVQSIRNVVESLVEAHGLDAQVISSGHSVDVLAADAGKARFFAAVQARFGPALAVGDQGAPGGNDFALLSATQLSVSVDSCSPALDRCWPIARSGRRGPAALVDVLGMLHSRGGRVQLLPPTVKNRDR